MKFLYRMDVSALMIALILVLLSAPTTGAWARTSTAEEVPAKKATRKTVLKGRASWYGREHQGHRTSNGERFDRNKYTCAHKTLPFGTRLRVTNPQTGKAVVVRVSDRGPFRHQRILDLSEIAARPLGIVTHGAVSVVAEVVSPETPLGPTDAPADLAELAADSTITSLVTIIEPGATEAADVVKVAEPAPTFIVQAGTFGDVRNAQAVQSKILALDNKLSVRVATNLQEGKPLNRVIVEGLADRAAAETVQKRLQQWGIAGLVRQKENL
ncbi:septal ring lytic transglycosylase RlpA family protein [Hymenobacter guriensis]|uniref:Probable endolytic peptidoglycan transglycosylase RlpA n=1 Tax=Hymenobacter guriensis TaxID=2793065 RepID=A0ABS0L0P3_9BACT|nr:septal ring lytic transglycosylase RlpA family protein [Hymenobacter guriensis]MBG8553138.1 septal ring lytic transglycosylase RlpA family protein [Hymenobacter guriensis]